MKEQTEQQALRAEITKLQRKIGNLHKKLRAFEPPPTKFHAVVDAVFEVNFIWNDVHDADEARDVLAKDLKRGLREIVDDCLFQSKRVKLKDLALGVAVNVAD